MRVKNVKSFRIKTMPRKILPSITTITPGEWKNKIREIDELGLEEAALFPTCLKPKERQKLYMLLEKTGIKSVPQVHIRGQDFAEGELDYLIKRFKTEVFNIHSHEKCRGILAYKKYLDKIYVENAFEIDELFWEFTEKTAGICLDLSHWEDFGIRLKRPGYENFSQKLRKYKIGCNHISAIKEAPHKSYDPFDDITLMIYGDHKLASLHELDYVKNYTRYLSDIISIELENSLAEQLKVKEYLKKII